MYIEFRNSTCTTAMMCLYGVLFYKINQMSHNIREMYMFIIVFFIQDIHYSDRMSNEWVVMSKSIQED